MSAPLALFRFFSSIKVLFYCHYPDMLLAKRNSWWRRLYRSPLDLTEQLTLGLVSFFLLATYYLSEFRHSTLQADKVLVNSEYTRETFARTFKSLYRSGLHPAVLYPAVGRRKVWRGNLSQVRPVLIFGCCQDLFEKRRNSNHLTKAPKYELRLSKREGSEYIVPSCIFICM